MDIKVKPEGDERDRPVSPQEMFGFQETKSQQTCSVWTNNSGIADLEIKTESMGRTLSGAQDEGITDYEFKPSPSFVSQAIGVKTEILNTSVEGEMHIVHTEQNESSTTDQINPNAHAVDFNPMSKIIRGHFYVNASKRRHCENCDKVGVDFDVGSGAKQQLDLKLLTNAVMIEISNVAKDISSVQYVISDILEYNFGLCIQDNQHSEFSNKTYQKVKYLMNMTKSKQQNPEFLKQYFELPMIMKSSTTFRSPSKHSHEIVSANQILNKDVEINELVTEEENCVPMASEEVVSVECVKAQQHISLMNFNHYHVKETMYNETDVPQNAFHTAKPGLKDGSTDILMQKKPDMDLISSHHVKMETIYTDTNVSWSDEEADQKPLRDRSFMTPVPEDGTKYIYPLCKKIGLDLDANLNVKMKEKLDISLLTKGTMIEVGLFAKKLCGTYRQILTELLECNFDIDFQNHKDLIQNVVVSLRLLEKKIRPNLKGLSMEERLELLWETFTIRPPTKRKHSVSVVSKEQNLDLFKKRDEKQTSGKVTLMRKVEADSFKRVGQTLQCFKTRRDIPEKDATQFSDKNAVFSNENRSTELCIKQEPNLDLVFHQDVNMEPDVTLFDSEAVQKGIGDQSLMCSTTEKTTKDLYPLCYKIGLELDVKSLLARTVKLDPCFLTKGVMYEVHTFVQMYKRFYTPSLYDILEYNFDFPFQHQNSSQLSKYIASKVKRFAEKYERGPVHYIRENVSQKLFKIDVMKCKIKNTAAQSVSDPPKKKHDLKMANEILQFSVNNSKSTEFGQLFAEGKFNDIYPNCMKVGVHFNVGSGTKKKLDIDLLTNGVMIEVSHFAKEMNRSHALVISDILEYNFDLGLHKTQQYEFASRIMAKVKYFKGKSKQQKPHLMAKVFGLPDPRSIPMSKTCEELKSLNDLVSFTLQFKKDVESQQLVMMQEEQCVPVMPFEENALVGYEKAEQDNRVSLMDHEKETISNETSGSKRTTPGLRNGPTDICVKYQPNMDLISPEHVKMETVSFGPNVSWSEVGHNLKRDQSLMSTRTKHATNNLYPLCQKIDLDLNVKPEPAVKDKLDLHCLTRGVMLELTRFASEMCGTYRQIVRAVLEYNFDLDFQNDLDLMDDIIHNIINVERKMSTRQWQSKGVELRSELLDAKFSMAPPWKRCGTANVSKQPVDYRRMKKKLETFTSQKIAQTKKTKSVLTKTDATQFANDTAVLCHEDRSAEIKEEFEGQSEVMEKAFHSKNKQVNICGKYIFEILMCRDTDQSKLMTSNLKSCFDQNNFKQILAKYRSDVLPLTVSKHGDFSHTEKRMVSLVSQLLCGLHLIEGLAHQAETTILLWERMILGDKVRLHASQNTGTTDLESRTVCQVKSVHDAVQQGWERDKNLPAFRNFLISKGELDEVPLCPYSESRIDGVFHSAAGVYCIYSDISEFCRDHEDDSSVLAAVAVDMEVQPFKAGCRALGLISKQIIDPLLKALTSEEKVLDMKVRYQTLVTKIKEWQEDGRNLVEGNVCLFDDIEVSKDLVFYRLTMWTDPDLFQLTVQIVELLLASFLIVCLNALPVDLQQVSKMDDRCRKDLKMIEQLQKAKANSISIAVEGMGMCKTNHTWEWLSSLDAFKIVSVLKALKIV
ncbi:uncharacterized protein LOC105013825 [Esox lucius]|uniref:uncharacterized protein LOC105013825 n=1 Tax=Esox lucius TaxID=8010 RepID=UPI00147764AE|nr:uncharacterized protein LOC105013825 [Esox lucius]